MTSPVVVSSLLASLRNCLLKTTFASAYLIGCSIFISAQVVNPSTQKTLPARSTAQETPNNRTSADETFDLNIQERRYVQDNFEASTAVGLKDGADKLNLEVGVALTAGRIDVLMRNVYGRVRFRGSLNRILEIINREPPSSSTSPAPPLISPE